MNTGSTGRAPITSRLSSTEGSGTCLPAAVLWTRTTAREIVRVIAEEAESGGMAPGPAMELIDRVWARAESAGPGELRSTGERPSVTPGQRRP